MTDLVIRPLAEGEPGELFRSLSTTLPDDNLVGRAILPPPRNIFELRSAGGEYRPEWSWLALRDGAVVARAAYWGGPSDQQPKLLEYFDFLDHADGVALLRAAPWDVEYELLLPPGWREHPAAFRAAERRMAAAEEAGYRRLTERFHYTWTPDRGLPERPGRLTFRPEPDDDVVLDVLARVHSDTRDHHALRAIEEHGGPEAAARQELEFFHWCPSPREWLRLAYTPEGELVGIQVPAHNPGGPCVGFVGVVPEQRGHSYGFDLLAECTHMLVAEGAERIAAATDVGNVGMAASFARAGYPIRQHRYCLVRG
ncbi:GNAT family N-acetyltransferase [Streptomyces sp. 3MP-14]|uniref:GNAT family N-acetyltransferase n=1 Tax=Streptomyces mimosae TaxID=2586635 RepID=A0A5N6AII9_9ACTN|nr:MULTISPECIES: GNAT family protein [Streptomyces]KAB8167826.1 GNAT family N-acetyltransferase [Streptomyces mimosae]KAB8177526.1 GNAT family N-acetyltransferase [Streptomyces sp. 3MP-14]